MVEVCVPIVAAATGVRRVVSESPLTAKPTHSSSSSSRVNVQQCNVASKVERRQLLSCGLVVVSSMQMQLWWGKSLCIAAAVAVGGVPEGFKVYEDILDGYSFCYPGSWSPVRGAGADAFYRSPTNFDENVVVDIDFSPISPVEEIEDLGTPDAAAKMVLKQYLVEFQSIRIGVRRECNILSAKSRIGEDGRKFYEVEVNARSYATNNEMGVTPADRKIQLEWNRRCFSVLGVENDRVYHMRLQVPENALEEEGKDLRQIMDSFKIDKL